MNVDMTNKKKHLLKEINMVSFAVVEMTEYLDTHPYDSPAIEYLCHYVRRKNELEKEYSKYFGPLQVCDITNPSNSFVWALSKMPWEGECE